MLTLFSTVLRREGLVAGRHVAGRPGRRNVRAPTRDIDEDQEEAAAEQPDLQGQEPTHAVRGAGHHVHGEQLLAQSDAPSPVHANDVSGTPAGRGQTP